MSITVTLRAPDQLLATTLPGFGTPALAQPAMKSGIRALILRAMEEGLAEDIAEPGDAEWDYPSQRVNMSLPDDLAGPVKRLAKAKGTSDGAMCTWLLYALLRKGVSSVPLADEPTPPLIAKFLTGWNAAFPSKPKVSRPAQNQFYGYIADSLSGSSIGLCEAATGTGKTLAMLLAAIDRLTQNPEARLLIAVPTIAVMRQFAEEYKEIERAGLDIIRLRTVIGRREFVSPREIQKILDDGRGGAEEAAVREWLSSGGTSSGVITNAWLMHTLKTIAPTFPAEAALIPEDPDVDDPGLIAYERQFASDDDYDRPEIILATHTMLAIDTRRRLMASARDDEIREGVVQLSALRLLAVEEKDELRQKQLWQDYFAERQALTEARVDISQDAGKLPPWHYLMVDEAHLLEQNFANALSQYVSLASFLSDCDSFANAGGRLTKAQLGHIRSCVDAIRKEGADSDTEHVWLHSNSNAQRRICAALGDIADLVSDVRTTTGKRAKQGLEIDADALIRLSSLGERIRRYAAALRLASQVTAGRSTGIGYVSFSPIRHYPQVHVGQQDVSSFLGFVWTTARAGAAVSATLYLPKGEGFTCWYQRTLLGINDTRAKEYPPVAPPWVYSQVEAIYLPPAARAIPKGETEARLLLRPPSRSDGLTEGQKDFYEKRWLTDLSTMLQSIYASAQGGVLVLMTSYATAQRLAELLPSDEFGEEVNLVVASSDTGTEKQKTRFLEFSKAGRRPIWLAVGGAWTGLDISGKAIEISEENDFVLTDLVIPRVPFGSNRSITHAYRVETNPSISWDVIEATFLFKQGLGRLIRRANLPGVRRIWVLDNRMNDASNLGRAFKQVRSLMAGYRREEAVFPR